MDPITALGVGGAAVQFAAVAFDAALGTIKLARELRDVPQRSALSSTTSRRRHSGYATSRRPLQDPASRIATRLQGPQIGILASLVKDGQEAVDVVHRKLESLLGPRARAASKLRKVWRAVVSVTLESELETDLGRVRRINDELIRQLQIASIDMQPDTGEAAELLRTEMQILRVDVAAAHETSFTALKSTLQQQHEASQEQFAGLRDTLMALFAEAKSNMPMQRALACRTSRTTPRADLTKQVCESALSHPAVLRQVGHSAFPPRITSNSTAMGSVYSVPPVCTCKHSRRRSSRRYGVLG